MSKIVDAIHSEGITKMAFEDRQVVESELKELKDQLTRTENPKDGTSPNPSLLQNVPQLKLRIKKLEDILTKDDDLVAKGDERGRLDMRRKELELMIKKEAPSLRQSLMTVSTNGQGDFDRSVSKTIAHQRNQGQNIREWQEIMRRLEPADPEACKVSKLYS